MKVGDVIAAYKQAEESHHQKVLECRLQLNRAQDQLEAAQRETPNWIENVVRPIAEAIVATMPGWRYEILGPFGLCSQVSIHFMRITERKLKNRYDRRNMRSLTFVPDLERVVTIRDCGKNTRRFDPNSIGELNGMNHPSVMVPTDADVAWLRKMVR